MLCTYNEGVSKANFFVISNKVRNLLIQRTAAFQEISPFSRNDGFGLLTHPYLILNIKR